MKTVAHPVCEKGQPLGNIPVDQEGKRIVGIIHGNITFFKFLVIQLCLTLSNSIPPGNVNLPSLLISTHQNQEFYRD